MITELRSNKPDRIAKREFPEVRPGRYLSGKRRRRGCWATVAILVLWDGLLLYMILCNLIDPVYGAVFVGLVSGYLGFQLVLILY